MTVLVLLLVPAFLIWFVFWFFFQCPVYCRSKLCLVGKTAIVTGANRGLGYETALNFASRGCKVILATRTDPKEVITKIIRITNNKNIVHLHLDLCSLASVRKFAEEINKNEERLDILVNNAGIAAADFNYTEDGLHPVCQTNHFGHFLLTHLLLDKLKKSGSSRIIFVSSALAFIHQLTLDTLNFPIEKSSPSDCYTLYGNTKLCNMITTILLAEKLKNTDILCFSVQPGLALTDVSNQMRIAGLAEWKIKFYFTVILRLFSKSAENGAQAIIKAAICDQIQNQNGAFIWDRGWFPMPLKTWDKQFCDQVWTKSEEYAKLKPEEKIKAS